MGGVNMWRGDKLKRVASAADGLIEVCSVSGANHLGRIKAGVQSASHLAQGSSVRITPLDTVAAGQSVFVQVDGEPEKRELPFVIEVSVARRAKMLQGPVTGAPCCDICC
jgi:hypothetical protein